jgi:hypothetical protein
MLAVIGAILFAIGWVLHLVHVNTPAAVSPWSLAFAGLFFLALHSAGFWTAYPWRRTPPAA